MSADLDNAIDRAVREMLDVEPPADLRRHVLTRLERPATFTDRVASSFSWKILVPAAAAAALIVAFMLPRRAEPPAQPQAIAHGIDQNLRVEHRAASPAAPTPRVSPTLVGAPRTAITVLAASAPETTTSDVEPLTSIAAIEVAPIEQRSIAPADIAVRPLNPIAEVQIAPLTPPDRRN